MNTELTKAEQGRDVERRRQDYFWETDFHGLTPQQAMHKVFRDAFALGATTHPEAQAVADPERLAQLIAHRACTGTEHDTANGKLHGCCVVCGVPWPCEYAGTPPRDRRGGAVASSD